MGGLRRAVVTRPGHQTMGMTQMPQSCQTWSRQRARAAGPHARLLMASGKAREAVGPAWLVCCCTALLLLLQVEPGRGWQSRTEAAPLSWYHAAQLSTLCIAASCCPGCSSLCQQWPTPLPPSPAEASISPCWPLSSPSCLCRRSRRSRHQPSWTQLNESGTDPSSSGPPARVAGLRSRRRPQALEDQATDSQVGALGSHS